MPDKEPKTDLIGDVGKYIGRGVKKLITPRELPRYDDDFYGEQPLSLQGEKAGVDNDKHVREFLDKNPSAYPKPERDADFGKVLKKYSDEDEKRPDLGFTIPDKRTTVARIASEWAVKDTSHDDSVGWWNKRSLNTRDEGELSATTAGVVYDAKRQAIIDRSAEEGKLHPGSKILGGLPRHGSSGFPDKPPALDSPLSRPFNPSLGQRIAYGVHDVARAAGIGRRLGGVNRITSGVKGAVNALGVNLDVFKKPNKVAKLSKKSTVVNPVMTESIVTKNPNTLKSFSQVIKLNNLIKGFCADGVNELNK